MTSCSLRRPPPRPHIHCPLKPRAERGAGLFKRAFARAPQRFPVRRKRPKLQASFPVRAFVVLREACREPVPLRAASRNTAVRDIRAPAVTGCADFHSSRPQERSSRADFHSSRAHNEAYSLPNATAPVPLVSIFPSISLKRPTAAAKTSSTVISFMQPWCMSGHSRL